jgi:hypothetical protein
MAIDSAIAASALAAGSKAHCATTDHQCHFVRGSQRLPVADAAGEFSQLEHGVWNFLALAE